VVQLKKALEDEIKSREVQLQDIRQKNAQQVEKVNVELDNAKKVRFALLTLFTFHRRLSVCAAALILHKVCHILTMFTES